MIGLTYRFVRDAENDVVEQNLLLATRRSGEAGESFKAKLHAYKQAAFGKDKALQRWTHLQRKLEKLDPVAPEYIETLDAAESSYDAMLKADQDMYAASEALVLSSLTENYGREHALELVDFLTEGDLRACTALIQSGELPADFIGYPGAQPKPSSTSPADSGQDESFSNTDSEPGTSKAGE